MTTTTHHHASDPGVLADVLMALAMSVGRGDAARLAADTAHIAPGQHVIDIGAGPGTAAREAARRGATVTAVDPSPAARTLNRLLTRSNLRSRIQALRGTAESLPSEDASADVVWALSSAHHWTDLDQAITEVSRTLRPAGRLIIIERIQLHGEPRAHHAVDPEWRDDLMERLRRAGFAELDATLERSGRHRRIVVSATAPQPPVSTK